MTPLLVAVLVIVLDQASKEWVRGAFSLHDTIPVIPGFFNLAHVLNKGAAFGFLNNPDSSWQIWFFAAVTCVAVGFIYYLLKTADRGDRFFIWGLGLILGGALGNLIDRLRFGHVVDFLDFYWGTAHFPSFNLADSAITVGAACLILDELLRMRRER